jgi:PiT family inorganic phosphate transporter
MVGWKRMVVVGEKIGKTHLTYAQGACEKSRRRRRSQLRTCTVCPVSTARPLSSGIAGTMAANGSGLLFAMRRGRFLLIMLTMSPKSATSIINFPHKLVAQRGLDICL